MIVEQVRLDPVGPAVPIGVRLASPEVGDDVARTPRLPRWTRQEILVLIQGKREAETRVQRGRSAAIEIGSPQAEPKWASISSYCKRHGVNRGPVQCRKRWSNLSGDYKKIRDWESQVKDDAESFWVMRSDLRRERRLPGFFDREVYDILDGAPGVSLEATILALAAPQAAVVKEEEVLFDSGRSAAEEEGMFSDQEDGVGSPVKEAPALMPMPISFLDKQYDSIPMPSQSQSDRRPSPPSLVQGMPDEKQPASTPEMGSASQDGRKRKRAAVDGEEEAASLHCQLIELMKMNGKILNSQLEAQMNHFKLEHEQRKDHVNSVVGVLSKLAEAMGKIADKL